MNENKPNSVDAVSNTDTGKRSFIKKATAVAGITTLAPTSAWGTCNASGVSGGSQQSESTCVMPRHYNEGRSPSWWKVMTKGSRHDAVRQTKYFVTEHGDEVNFTAHDTLELASSNLRVSHRDLKNTTKPEFYYEEIKKFISAAGSFTVTNYTRDNIGSAGNNAPVTITINVFSALSGHGKVFEEHLAAVYINHLLGLSAIPASFGTSGSIFDLLEHYYGVYQHGQGMEVSLNNAYKSVDIPEKTLIEKLSKMY